MGIKQIKVSNFKSFRDLDISLDNLNLLIGANASGKSSFISIPMFLKNITNYGLEDAISMQGGVEYSRNTIIGPSEDLSLCIVLEQRFNVLVGRKGKHLLGMATTEVVYEFALSFNKRGSYKVSKDRLTLRGQLVELTPQRQVIDEAHLSEITLTSISGKTKTFWSLPDGVTLSDQDKFPPFIGGEKIPSKALILEAPHLTPPNVADFFSDLAVYDFDPRLAKKAVPITGRTELEEDASNLAIVLNRILANKSERRKFTNLIKDLLPFVEDFDVEKFADRSLLFKMRETHCKDTFLPAFLMSDGTVNIAALIVAMYFERKPLVFVEEPERNIHPSLISKVVSMLKEASETKQIVISTHNPEMVKYADLQHLLLISRDSEGFSIIRRPSESKDVQVFLEHEIGVEELYVQNLLGV